jgi:hypothetical protein
MQRRPKRTVTQHRMPLNDGAISYAKAGAGPVVLLSHDLAGTRRAWQHLIPGLARTVIHRRGQTVGAGEQLSLPREVPLLIAWGVDDETIPSHHHHASAKRVPLTRHGVTPSLPGQVSSSDHQVRH